MDWSTLLRHRLVLLEVPGNLREELQGLPQTHTEIVLTAQPEARPKLIQMAKEGASVRTLHQVAFMFKNHAGKKPGSRSRGTEPSWSEGIAETESDEASGVIATLGRVPGLLSIGEALAGRYVKLEASVNWIAVEVISKLQEFTASQERPR
jgi:hypothetical protein